VNPTRKGKRKMHKNLLMVLLLLALMLFSTSAALAQDLPGPFCGDLSEEDCDILTQSQAAQLEVTSSTSTLNMVASVAGIPGLPADELVFSWMQNATIHMDPEVMMQMIELQMAGPEEIMENMDSFADLTVEMYRTLELDAEVSLSLPAEVAAMLSAQAGLEVPEDLAMHVILKDGIGYLATEDLAFIDPSIATMGEWFGVDIAGAVEMGFAQSMNEQSAADQQAMMQSMAISSLFNSEETRGLLEGFVVVERLEDSEVEGAEAAVFESGFDFAGFLSSPGFWSLISENLDTINAMADMQLTEAELQQAQMGMTFLGPALLQGLTFASSTTIGLDDNLPYEQTIDFAWDLSSLLSFAASTGALPAGSPSEASVSLEIDSTSGDYNSAPEIEAPEDAIIIPLEAMAGAQ
jgi:hypothetical protein